MEKKRKNLVLAGAGVVAGLWLLLFLSGRGVLVWSQSPEGTVGSLQCSYFTGTGLAARKFLYSEQGFLGRDACPRLIVLD